MYGESNMETYITICNIDSRRTGRQVGARDITCHVADV